jgi:hypothetical protein
VGSVTFAIVAGLLLAAEHLLTRRRARPHLSLAVRA